MALTDTKIKNAKPEEKPYKMGDAGGLYLLVNPSGSLHVKIDLINSRRVQAEDLEYIEKTAFRL